MATEKQQVLMIGKVWIEPASSAAGTRSLQLIHAFLEMGWQVSFATSAGDSIYKANLAVLGVNEFKIALNSDSFDVFIRELSPTLVIFDRFSTEEQFGWRVATHCPDALRVLDTIDLHCLRVARQTAYKEQRVFEMKDLVNDTALREIAAIYRCDLSLMISEVEMDLLITQFRVPETLLHYTPFLQDPLEKETTLAWPSFEQRAHFLSIGNFLHAPNWDAVLFLKQEIWPLIRQQLPKAEMHVYGAYPSQKVFELHQPKDNFFIKGRAEDAGTVMSNARICLAPLRFGAGIKGKLLDAMLYGTPSVTTAIGAESMQGNMPWNGAVAESAEDLASAAVRLYQEKAQWQQAQQNGINIIGHFFSKKIHSQKLIHRLQDLQNRLAQHRIDNFTGAMLMHHSLSATKYMALWIAAKNK